MRCQIFFFLFYIKPRDQCDLEFERKYKRLNDQSGIQDVNRVNTIVWGRYTILFWGWVSALAGFGLPVLLLTVVLGPVQWTFLKLDAPISGTWRGFFIERK